MSAVAGVVFVVDDDPTVRTVLGRQLKSAGLSVQTFPSAEAFLQFPRPDTPGCAVLDILMPGLSGLDLQRTLSETAAALPIVFITGYGDVSMSVRAMKAGAVDFLTKPFNPKELLSAVQQGIARHAQTLQAESEMAELRKRADTLSPRERQVMALVVTGLPNKRIGVELGVCEKTVKAHRGQVMRKMRAGSLPELVRMAERLGIGPAPH
jgi:FixJ family two-component response regulator